MVQRLLNPVRSFIPYFSDWTLNSTERLIQENVVTLRTFVRDCIREQIKRGLKEGMLLTIMMGDDMFTNNEELMVDEVIDFFVAASLTNSAVSATMIHYFSMNAEARKKLRQEINERIL